MARLEMTLAVVGTLSTNKQSNKQKETKTTLNFSMMSYGITSTVMGSGFYFIESEATKRVPAIRRIKRNTSLSYQKTLNRSNKDKTLIPAKNSHITYTLNLITYVYMSISST